MDAGRVMGQIDAGASALDTAGKEIGKAITEAAEAELAYREALEVALLKIREDFRDRGERLPAEDLRNALAHQGMDRRLYGEHIRTKARVDALRSYVRALESELSGRQSLLAAMKAEGRIQP